MRTGTALNRNGRYQRYVVAAPLDFLRQKKSTMQTTNAVQQLGCIPSSEGAFKLVRKAVELVYVFGAWDYFEDMRQTRSTVVGGQIGFIKQCTVIGL